MQGLLIYMYMSPFSRTSTLTRLPSRPFKSTNFTMALLNTVLLMNRSVIHAASSASMLMYRLTSSALGHRFQMLSAFVSLSPYASRNSGTGVIMSLILPRMPTRLSRFASSAFFSRSSFTTSCTAISTMPPSPLTESIIF